MLSTARLIVQHYNLLSFTLHSKATNEKKSLKYFSTPGRKSLCESFSNILKRIGFNIEYYVHL